MRRRRLLFVTGNRHKLEEANAILAPFNISLEMADCRKLEIQSASIAAIAGTAARSAAKRLCAPAVVEDSGLFVRALGGFPGPYSSYAYRTLGCEGILRLLSGVEDRRAAFRCAVAYCLPGSRPRIFTGTSLGSISPSMRGSGGFGFDPIFVPDGGGERTFAEMDGPEKSRLSHRGNAFRAFGRWYSSDPCL